MNYMKKLKISFIPAAVVGLLAASTTANAWTTITPVAFTKDSSTAVMNIKSKSFSDPAFGHQAWAMHGKWGILNAEKGKRYTITVDGSAVPGLHPAISAWKRPIGANLAEAKYVPDHNFFPAQSYINSGKSQQHVMESGGGTGNDVITRKINGADVSGPIKDFWKAALRPGAEVTEATGVLLEDGKTDIGFPRMLFVGAAYDVDGASPMDSLNVNPALDLQRDGRKGRVTLTFRADETAQYEFFVGAMNPDQSHTVAFNDVNVSVGFPMSFPWW